MDKTELKNPSLWVNPGTAHSPRKHLCAWKLCGEQGKAGFLRLLSNSNCSCSLWPNFCFLQAPHAIVWPVALRSHRPTSSQPIPVLSQIVSFCFCKGFQWCSTGPCLSNVLSVPMEAVKPQPLPLQSLRIKADFAAEGRKHLDNKIMTCSHVLYSAALPIH